MFVLLFRICLYYKTFTSLDTEAYSQLSETSKMKIFGVIKAINYFWKKFHNRYLSGFWTYLSTLKYAPLRTLNKTD